MVQIEPVLAEAEQEAKLSRDLWHMGQADEAILKGFVERHARYIRQRSRQGNTSTTGRRIAPNSSRCSRPSIVARSGEMAAKRRKLAA